MANANWSFGFYAQVGPYGQFVGVQTGSDWFSAKTYVQAAPLGVVGYSGRDTFQSDGVTEFGVGIGTPIGSPVPVSVVYSPQTGQSTVAAGVGLNDLIEAGITVTVYLIRGDGIRK